MHFQFPGIAEATGLDRWRRGVALTVPGHSTWQVSCPKQYFTQAEVYLDLANNHRIKPLCVQDMRWLGLGNTSYSNFS